MVYPSPKLGRVLIRPRLAAIQLHCQFMCFCNQNFNLWSGAYNRRCIMQCLQTVQVILTFLPIFSSSSNPYVATASLSGVLAVWDLHSHTVRQQCKHEVSFEQQSEVNVDSICPENIRVYQRYLKMQVSVKTGRWKLQSVLFCGSSCLFPLGVSLSHRNNFIDHSNYFR